MNILWWIVIVSYFIAFPFGLYILFWAKPESIEEDDPEPTTMKPDMSNYVSDRVYEGTRPVSKARADHIRKKWAERNKTHGDIRHD